MESGEARGKIVVRGAPEEQRREPISLDGVGWRAVRGATTMRSMLRMAMVVMLTLSGCAYAFQEHLPTHRAPGELVACTTSRRWAWIDLGIAGGAALAGAAGVAIHANVGHVDIHEDRGNVIAGVGLFAALIQYASADTGFGWAKECQAARAEVAGR